MDGRYQEDCVNVTSPRIPNYNHTNDDFHQLVSAQPPLTHDDEVGGLTVVCLKILVVVVFNATNVRFQIVQTVCS